MFTSFLASLLLLLKFPWKTAWGITRWILQLGASFVLKPIFRDSHQHYIDSKNARRRWAPLLGGIEYQLNLEAALTSEPAPVSTLWLRNIGNAHVTRLNLNVEAKRGKLRMPEPVYVPSIPAGEFVIFPLNKIPPQRVDVVDGNLLQAYETVRIIDISMQVEGKGTVSRDSSPQFTPTNYIGFVNPWYRRFAGRIYNVKAIEDYLSYRQQLCHYRLSEKIGLMPYAFDGQIAAVLRRRTYWHLPMVLFNAVNASLPARLTYCWFMLIIRQRKIRYLPDGRDWWESSKDLGDVRTIC